jgi:Zn-dependent metalloprotease
MKKKQFFLIFLFLVLGGTWEAKAFKGEDLGKPKKTNQTAAAPKEKPKRKPQPGQTQAFEKLQKEDAGVSLDWDAEEGTPRCIRGKGIGRQSLSGSNSLATQSVFQGTYSQRSLAVMDNLAPLYRLKSAKQEFRSKQNEEPDQLGYRHQRLEQVHQGIPVLGGDVSVHFDGQNNPYEVNGKYIPDLNLSVTPSISANQAVDAAKADFVSNKGAAADAIALVSGPDLVVYALGDSPVLTYQIVIRTRSDNTWKYWINAHTGAVVRSVSTVCKIAAPTKTGGTAATLTGTRSTGEGGAVVSFAGWSQNGVYYMYDPANYYYLWNANNSATATAPTTPTLDAVQAVADSATADLTSPAGSAGLVASFTDPSTYAYRSTTNWGTTDPTEVSIAVNMGKVFEYYRTVHNRNGVNGANGATGKAVAAVVHFDSNYVNAYWDGTAMYFGDGDNVQSTSLGVLDVCGHELTHGVTEFSANLNYQDESGALNESFSDVMGETIEFYAQPDGRATYPNDTPGSADWKLGEDCWLEGSCLRDMRNPSSTVTMNSGYQQPSKYGGTYWQNYKTDTSDNGGVHQNSGPQNFFYYLLCDGGSGTNDGLSYSVTGIGVTNARLVAYRALTVYCTTTTDYKGARDAWVSAANDLNPAWVPSVKAAWNAVGVLGTSPVITSATSLRGAVGSSLSYQIVATQTPISFAATGLPAGVTVNSGTGLISGTPTVAGTFNVSISATNSDGTGTASLQILILPPDTAVSSITSFNPASGAPGSLVVLTGSNLAGASAVKFNGVAATFTVDSATQITATVPGNAASGRISVTNSFGTGTSVTDFVVIPVLLSEDFAALTSGDNTSTSNQSTAWAGDALFPTVVKGYQAGGALKLGTSSAVGSITSKALDLSGGEFDVSFDVKGWTTVEGGITVTVTGQTAQTVTYTSVMSGTFQTKSVHFSAGTTTTTITLATTAKRAFLDNIIVTKSSSSVTAPMISSSLSATGTVGTAFSYQITASGSPTSYGATGLPAGLNINTGSGAITGTPTVAGTFNVTLSATNSAGTGSATLAITINSSASAPVISSSLTATGTVGTAFSYQIAASGSPTSFGATGLPAGLNINTGTGAITGTPAVAGTSNVSISATNGSGTGTATLVITVSPSGGGGGGGTGTNGVLLGWNMSGQSNFGTSPLPPTVYVTNLVTVGGLTRSVGVATNGVAAARAWGGSSWTNTNCLASFTVSVADGYKLSLSNIPTFDYRRSGTGASNGVLQYSTNGTVFSVITNLAYTNATSSGGSLGPISLSNVSALQNIPSGTTVTFQIVNTNGVSGGTWYIFDKANTTGNDFEIAGSVDPVGAGTPTVSVSGTLAAVNTTYGTPSAVPTSFTVSGSNLTGAISIAAPSGYEISQTAGGAAGYATTQTVGAAGTVAAKTIYVRLMATTPVGSYAGNVTCNSAGSAGATVATVASSVAKKQLTITGLTGKDRIYNGGVAAELIGTPIYVGLVNGESLSVTGVANATFANKNVGLGKTVTISGFTDPNGNYSVTLPTVTASITAKEVVILGLNGVNKTYDGMISVSLGGTPSLLGVETADQANVVLGGSPTASLVSANAGFGVGMVVSGYTLSGSEAGNYQLVQPVGLAADIQPKPATITAKNQTKTVGTVINLGPGQREFSATGLVEGEVIDTVTLVSNGGTQAQDPVGSYVITASDPVGGAFNRFRVGNYNFDYRTGTLTVSGGPATVTLADWATQNGLSGADAAPAADPDGDGVSNLMAYFMALDPKGGQGLAGYGVKEVADSSVSLTYRRAKRVTGVTAQVQSAGDLSSGWGTNGVQETVVDKGAYEEVTATVTTPPGSTKMFMRLSVQSQ